ncbi:MAG: hypothetical protein OES38_15670 [Gammaproteobacteria bacterium]|nr:hypothetical protein [Gammaproteobacteria bacterium]
MFRKLWLASMLVIYALFFGWYTSFSGPLTEQEIQVVLEHARDARSASDVRVLEAFMRSDTGDDFVMVNLLELNENPPDLPATGPGAAPMDLINHYMEHMYVAQFKRACHPLFFGRAVGGALDLSGIEGAERWTQAALFRYRSRRDVLEIVLNPAFDERHDYKMAALLKTIAVPVEASLLIDLRLFVALLLFTIFSIVDWLAFRRRV